MTIDQLVLINYRSWKDCVISFSDSTPQVFIGLNDSGKSSILHGLDLLLGEKPKYYSVSDGKNKTDLSNSVLSIEKYNMLFESLKLPKIDYHLNETILLGKLSFVKDELTLFAQANLSDTLMWAIENAQTNHIWIAKVFNGTNSTIYLLLKDTNLKSEFWSKTSADLKQIIKDKGITSEDISNLNGKGRFSKIEQINAIYSKESELIDTWAEYKFQKADKDIFPIFKYYDWNCSFDDINALANSIMHEHIKIYLQPIKDFAQKASEEAEAIINSEFSKLSKEINKVARGINNIKSKVFFDLKETISDILVNKDNGDGDIHMELQGEGLKRQIWFSLIKAKAEQDKIQEFNQFIWAFDEPETHLYPGAQRELFEILKRISLGNIQSIISTHSTIFIDKSKISDIKSVCLNNEGYSEINSCFEVDDIHKSLSVKNSDFLFYDKFLVVEGDTEQYLIPRLYEIFTNRTLINDNIQLINIHGKNNWLSNKSLIEKIMKGFKKPENSIIYLFDNDMKYEIGKSAITEYMFFVGIQDIEDAIDETIWEKIIKDVTDIDVNIDAKALIEIKNKLPKDRVGEKNEKFYYQVENEIKNKLRKITDEPLTYSNLPSKGYESSELILRHLTSIELIPSKIIDAFKLLLK